MADLNLGRYRRQLVDLFKVAQSISHAPFKNRLLVLKLQEEMVLRIKRSERVLTLQRVSNDRLKQSIAKDRLPREQVRAKRDLLEQGRERIEQQRRLLDIYRTVGDCIAFVFGDRYEMRQFAFHPPAGFLSGKRGLRAELDLLRNAFNDGFVAVLNDLTHSLRHGDVTIYDPTRTGSLGATVEVKTGNVNQRGERQLLEMNRIYEYIKTDKAVVDGITKIRIAATADIADHRQELRDLIASLSSGKSFAHALVEPGLLYIAIGTANCDVEAALDSIKESGIKRPFVFFANDFKQVRHGYYPFPLLFDDPEVAFRFYSGELYLIVVVDMDAVNRALSDLDISIRIDRKNSDSWRIESGTHHLYKSGGFGIGAHLIARLAAEFVTLTWFLDSVRSLLSELPGEVDRHLKTGVEQPSG